MAIGRFLLQMCGWLVGLPLEVLIIVALVRGPYRRYPLVLLYMAASFVTTLVEIPVIARGWIIHEATVTRQAAIVYWVDEWILNVLVFATVLSLVNQAISLSRRRRAMRAALTGGAILFAAISFLINYRPPPEKFGVWMTPWTRDLHFCGSGLDLVLWTILIAARQKDRQLLLVSGALGMHFAGEAIGEALVNLALPNTGRALSLTGSAVDMVADLACFYVLWQTFRSASDRTPSMPSQKRSRG